MHREYDEWKRLPLSQWTFSRYSDSLSFRKFKGGATMVQKVAAVALIVATLAIVGCNTVRGAAADVNSAASCTQNAMHGDRC